MKLALVRACTRSACFELQNNTCYTAPAPFRVQLNGQIVLEACCTNVFSVFSLEPGKTYHLEVLATDGDTPAYYEDYLKKQYPEEYRNPIEAFREIDQTTEFPEMYRLLSELQSYRGTGIAAKLYYESKVAEALSLVVEYQKKRSVSDHKLASQDLERIQTVAAYLSDHYAGELPIERLAQIACMGTTKLKSSFKKVYGCTITEYIQQRRMSQAEYLLAHTDLQIGQIAQTIGYSTSSRFAELFRRSTGLLPLEYRKMAKRK